MSPAPCQACGQPVPAHHTDWCSRACRTALRAYGSALEPQATRQQQMAAALAQRQVMGALGRPMPERFRQAPAR